MFKSTPENYNKELSGVKNNTCRVLSQREIEELYSEQGLDFIEIVNTETKQSFTRKLRDITKLVSTMLPDGYRIYIFTW